jgi:GNAT superfamily N-acetyltransferase
VERRYVEPGRTYTTSLVLLAVMVAGFVVDFVVIGGGRSHLIAWTVGIVLVVGVDVLATHAARAFRTITVTDEALTVGEDSIPRSDIVAVDENADSSLPVLGRRYGDGVPRNMVGIALHLAGGERRVVATRHPGRLVAALDVGRAQPVVRPAEPVDLPYLAEIDERAEILFRVYGVELPQIPLAADSMHDAKVVYVAGRPPVGFLQIDEVDGLAHIQALAVLPSHMRKGLGTALLDAACSWSADHGYPAITLCTYAEIPWNGPFYTSRGFVETDDITPELAELRDWERDVGLDELGRRCVMRRELVAGAAELRAESPPSA